MMQFWFWWRDSQNNCHMYIKKACRSYCKLPSIDRPLCLCLCLCLCLAGLLPYNFQTWNFERNILSNKLLTFLWFFFFPCSFLTRAKRWNKFWICKGVKRRTCKAERTSDSDMGCASDIMLVSSSAHYSLRRAIPWSFEKLRLPITPHITPAHKWWLLYLNQSWCGSTLQMWIKTEVPFLYYGGFLDKWSCWGIATCTTSSSCSS
jgi:hypothetical protein